jgi:hypothetical protein
LTHLDDFDSLDAEQTSLLLNNVTSPSDVLSVATGSIRANNDVSIEDTNFASHVNGLAVHSGIDFTIVHILSSRCKGEGASRGALSDSHALSLSLSVIGGRKNDNVTDSPCNILGRSETAGTLSNSSSKEGPSRAVRRTVQVSLSAVHDRQDLVALVKRRRAGICKQSGSPISFVGQLQVIQEAELVSSRTSWLITMQVDGSCLISREWALLGSNPKMTSIGNINKVSPELQVLSKRTVSLFL